MSAVIGVSLSATPIYRGTTPTTADMILMGSGVYIHAMTPELARQWIGVLESIAGVETAPKSPE